MKGWGDTTGLGEEGIGVGIDYGKKQGQDHDLEIRETQEGDIPLDQPRLRIR